MVVKCDDVVLCEDDVILTHDELAEIAEKYRRMVSQLACKIYQKLPPHTRVWLSLDDLIQDGMNWVVTTGIPKYQKEKAAMSTFLHEGVENYLKNYTYRAYQSGRYEGGTISICDLDLVGIDGHKYSLETRVEALRDTYTPETILRECWVVPMMLRVFKRATAMLRRELKRWFFRDEGERLQHLDDANGCLTDGQLNFVLARSEFLGLANDVGLGYDECHHLMTRPGCQGQLKFALAGL